LPVARCKPGSAEPCGFYHIPSFLVVKIQAVDIIGLNLPIIRGQNVVETFEFIPIKSLAATDSSAPGSCAGHHSVPSPERGRPPSTNGSGLSPCGRA
jgi:hypothetical protein